MCNPHGVEKDNSSRPELNSYRQRLIVRVGGDLGGSSSLPDRRPAEQFPDRARAVSENRRIGHERNGSFPIFETLARWRARVFIPIALDFTRHDAYAATKEWRRPPDRRSKKHGCKKSK